MYKGIKTIKIKTISIKSINIDDKLHIKSSKKIRDPVKYLVERHGIPKQYAKAFLAQSAYIHTRWKEDSSGPYVNIDDLDIIGYGWNKDRDQFFETLESSEKTKQIIIKKQGKPPQTKAGMEKAIKKLPMKYQKDLRRTQRIMKIIKKR